MAVNKKFKKLQQIIKASDSALVAFSGGVDSTFLAAVAQEILGRKMSAVTVVTPFLSKEEKQWVKETAKRLKLNHFVRRISLPEGIMKNHKDRCYVCKKEIFGLLCQYQKKKGYACVMEGSNQDDLNDYRPGRKALRELQIRSPLQEAGLRKKEIRRLAKGMGLLEWDRSSSPCLATRFPYGEKLVPKKIAIVDETEGFLKRLDLRSVRVRVHGTLARIEVEKKQIPVLLENRDKIVRRFKRLGIHYICVDLEGYRCGAMNEDIVWKKQK